MKSTFSIKGITDSNVESVLSELKAEFSGVGDIRLDENYTVLEITLDRENAEDAGRRAAKILAKYGASISPMSDGKRYSFIGKTKKISLVGAVCIALVCTVLSVLLTFALCVNFMPSGIGESENESTEKNDGYGPSITPGDTATPGGSSGSADSQLPSYFQNLVKLDEIFKYYSFDGIDEEKMQEAILDAYISATGDLYAEYLNAEEYEEFFSDRNGEFVGIGVSIVNSEITVNGQTLKVMEIISVFDNSPALEYGVMVGDCIMYVDNGGEMTLVNALGYTKALDVMLGDTGTEAKFIVFREDGGDYKQIEFSIPRRKVTTQSVTYKISSADSKVGIINITGFDLTTPTQFKNAVNTLKGKGCEYFVFDVRNNPGGALDSIETVLTYFLETGDEIISTEYTNGYTVTAYAGDPTGISFTKDEIGMYKDLNCIVLTNENTASAAELFTATLRDYGIAKVIGQTTYGKGCMQSLIPLSSYGLEGGLKLTVAMYYSASKTVYHGIGIEPDYKIDLSDEAKKINIFLLPEDKDAQLQKALEILTK